MAKTDAEPVTEAVQDVPATDEGAAALIRTLPEFDVTTYEGQDEIVTHYKMRPLGIGDAFRMLRVISAGANSMAHMASQGLLKDGQGVMYAILGTIPYAERDVKELLSSLLTYEVRGKDVKVTFDEFEKLPLDAIVPLIEGIASHPDLNSFLKNVRGLANSPAMARIRQEVANSQPAPQTN